MAVDGYIVQWTGGETSMVSLRDAVALWAEQVSQEPVSAPRIFVVRDDGTRAALPTYEEALAASGMPPAVQPPPTPKDRDYARALSLWKSAGNRIEECGDRRDAEGCDDAEYDQQNYAIAVDLHSGANRPGALAELRRRYDVLAGFLMLRGGTNFVDDCRAAIAQERWCDLVERISSLEWDHITDKRLRWVKGEHGIRVAEPTEPGRWHIPESLYPGHPFDPISP